MAHIFWVRLRKFVPLLVAAAAFLFAWFVWPHGVIAALLAAGVGYVAARVVMFPKPGSPGIRRIGPGVDPAALEGTGVEASELEAAIKSGRADCNSLQNLAFRIGNPAVRETVQQISELAYQIVEDVKKDPKDLKAARQFFGYYLGAAVKVVASYADLASRQVLDAEAQAACRKVEGELPAIRDAFAKQLQILQENNVIDLDVELSVLKRTIQMEGLADAPRKPGEGSPQA